jgi:hypothetical protein
MRTRAFQQFLLAVEQNVSVGDEIVVLWHSSFLSQQQLLNRYPTPPILTLSLSRFVLLHSTVVLNLHTNLYRHTWYAR